MSVNLSNKPFGDSPFMVRAVELAAKGAGWASPNPLVGAIIEKDGKIIGEGFHEKWKSNHAEVNAIQNCTDPTDDSTLFVTLEPCNKTGYTTACTEAIIKAKIKRVVVGTLDPTLNCGGVEALKLAGIEVIVVDDADSIKLIRPFVTHRTKKRPYVTVKIAATLDGKVATQKGESKWITCEDSRREGHLLRHRSDAVLVGVDTILADDPLLTTRIDDAGFELHQPIRIVVDSELKIPVASKVITDRTSETIIATTQLTSIVSDKFEKEGVSILRCDKIGERVSLRDLLRQLSLMNITSLLVEGGPTIIASFFRENLVDHVIQFISPSYLGGNCKPAIGDLKIEELSKRILLKDLSINKCGVDFVVAGDVNV